MPKSPDRTIQIGSVLNVKGHTLTTTELLGVGANGTVFNARWRPPGAVQSREVAVKVQLPIPGSRKSVPEQFREMQKEPETMQALAHPRIVPIELYGIDEFFGVYVYVMPKAQESLRKYMKDMLLQCVSIPMHLASIIIQQAAEALQYAHDQEIIHRDVKPDNLLVKSTNPLEMLLTDFGIAKRAVDLTLFHENVKNGSPEGTVPYMAPEQVKGKAGRRSDQWALAVIAYQMAAKGERPFVGDSEIMLMTSIIQHEPRNMEDILQKDYTGRHRAVEEVILKALEKHPESRFQSIMNFANSYQHAVRETSPRDAVRETQYLGVSLQKTEAAKNIRKALQLIEKEEYGNALSLLENARELDPENMQSHYFMYQVLIAQSRPDEAIVAMEKVSHLTPHLNTEHAMVADALAVFNKNNEAVQEYDAALALGLREGQIFANKALALAKLQHLPDALSCFDEAIAADPNNADHYLKKGLLLELLDRDEEAMTQLVHAFRLRKTRTDTLNTLQSIGKLLQKLGKHDEAFSIFLHILTLRPGEPKAEELNKQIKSAQQATLREGLEAIDTQLIPTGASTIAGLKTLSRRQFIAPIFDFPDEKVGLIFAVPSVSAIDTFRLGADDTGETVDFRKLTIKGNEKSSGSLLRRKNR